MRRLSLILVLSIVAATAAFAQVPQTLSWQGVLLDDGGALVPDGAYALTIRIYNVGSGGAALFTESFPAVPVSRGSFSVLVGSTAALTLPFDVPYWMGVQVGAGAELAPRIPLAASPYALSLRLPFTGTANGTGAAFTVRNNSGPAVLADGTIRTGSTTATGRVLGYGQGAANPAFELQVLGTGGSVRVRDEGNFTYGQLEGDANGTGAFFAVDRNQGSSGFTVDGNFAGSEEPRVSITGSARSAVFDLGQSGDDAVVLPTGAIGALEQVDEPGVASTLASAGVALTGIYQNLLTRTITCPTSGYVVVMATGEVQYVHAEGTFSQCRLSISDVSAAAGAHDVGYQISGFTPTGTFQTPFAAQAVFPVTAGAHTFYLVGINSSTDATVAHRSLTLMFFPTSYGTVTSGLVANGGIAASDETADPSSDAAREPLEASRVAADRVERELRSMQARFDKLRAELDAARAAQRTEVARAEAR